MSATVKDTAYSSATTSSSPSYAPYFSTRAFALHSIPISYALAFPPHIYMFGKAMLASQGAASNLVPRANLDRIASLIPRPTLDTLWKARGCHLNALEGFPLFAAAMLAGTYVQVDRREMNICAAEYLGARVLYSVLYLTVQSEKTSYLRSAAYFWSIGIPFYVLWKAGWKAVEEDKRPANL